jgi:uncharacterized repeat protein (TIGR01451 family)
LIEIPLPSGISSFRGSAAFGSVGQLFRSIIYSISLIELPIESLSLVRWPACGALVQTGPLKEHTLTVGPFLRVAALLALVLIAVTAMLASASSALAATFTVTNTGNEGAGSLRKAIEEVNIAGAGNTIAFNIPGTGPFTIAPTSALPGITVENTTIDACTQPGADCSGLPLTLMIRLNGQGFSLVKSGATIRGFSFTGGGAPAVKLNRVAEEGIFTLQQNVTIADNYIGLAPDGSAAGKEPSFVFEAGNRNINRAANGLHILDNVIGANKTGGSAIDLSSTGFGTATPMSGLRIEGNIIGLDPTGTQARPNAGGGILVEDSGGTRIVGNTVADNKGFGIVHRGRTQLTPHSDPATEPGLRIEGNRIEGNEKEGIGISIDNNGISQKEPFSGPATILGNTVKGNGTAGSFAGIAITEAPDTQRPNIQIGGFGPGQANTVSGNTGAGVAIGASATDTSISVQVRGNSIYGNGGLPIDLGNDGATANAPAGTVRTGPNSLVDRPVITGIGHGSVVLAGTYAGPPSATVTLDFYKNETASGPQTWIGSTPVTTNVAGEATFRAEFEPDVPAGWFIAATATDAADSTSEFTVPALVPAAETDLAISNSASAASAEPGEPIEYTLLAENKGLSTSNPTTVTDALPPGLSYVSNTGGCDVSALPLVSCDLGSLLGGEARTIHIVAQLTAGSGAVTNTATIGGPLPDPESANNTASATTTVEPVSDLAITTTAGASFVKTGEHLSYTLAVRDNGPSPSGSETVTDTLPAGLTYVSDTGGCDTSALSTITCELGPLASGGEASVEIVTEVKVGPGATIENAARVSGPNPDPESGNDESSAATPVVPFAADLALQNSASSSGPVKVGDTITYTLTATDHGPDASPETVVTDELPAGLTYFSDDRGCRTTALPRVECDLGTLASGESRSVRVVARVASVDGGPVRDTATVSGAQPDPNPANNAATAETTVASATSPPAPPGPLTAGGEAPKSSKHHAHHKRHHPKMAGTPKLLLKQTSSTGRARPSSVVVFTVTVWNKGDGDARQVKVCDEPGNGLTILRTEPTAGKDPACWHLKSLAAGARRVYRVTAQVGPLATSALARNVAWVGAANVKGVRTARAGVRVKPLPNTACGSSAFSLGIALRC